MATHFSILAWKIPWTEEQGGLQSMGLQKVGHNWAQSTYLSLLRQQCFLKGSSGHQNPDKLKWKRNLKPEFFELVPPKQIFGEGNGNLLPYFGLENSKDRGAWQATVYGIQGAGHDWGTNTFTFTLGANFRLFVVMHTNVLKWEVTQG